MDLSGAPTSLRHILSEMKLSQTTEVHLVAMRGGVQIEYFRPLCSSILTLTNRTTTGVFTNLALFVNLLLFLYKHKKTSRVLINSTTNLRAMLACKMLGIRSFVYVRESESMVLQNRLGFLRRYMLRFMTGVICVSHSTAEWVNKHVPSKKIKVLHNGVDLKNTDILHTIVGVDSPVIGIIGSLDYRKGIDRFYELIDFCNNRDVLYRYKIIGDVSEEIYHLSNYKDQFRDAKQVSMTGFIDNVMSEIAECSAVVMLSRQEALPRVILEAGIIGVPVLALDVAGTGEMLPKNYKYLLPETSNVSILSYALEDLIKKNVDGSIGQSNRKFIKENFDRQVLVADLIRYMNL